MKKILIVCAHPDDEIIGLGGTIRKRVLQGDLVHCIILGEGLTSRGVSRHDTVSADIERLHQNTLEAAGIIGYACVMFKNLPDNRFDSVDLLDVVKLIEGELLQFQPDIVYTHHHGDLNIDHRITFQAVITATRPVGSFSVKEIYSFETLSSTEWNFDYQNIFKPNIFVNIETTLQDKLKAMSLYHTELCLFPHPRSLKALEINAQKWGFVVGKNFVEAFELIRGIYV